MIHYFHEDNPSKVKLEEGDEVEYITRSGDVIELDAVKSDGCKDCWFMDEANKYRINYCAQFICTGLILKPKCDDEDELIKLSTIQSALCNSDVCIYYSNECIQSYSSNKSCLINIIIGDTR